MWLFLDVCICILSLSVVRGTSRLVPIKNNVKWIQYEIGGYNSLIYIYKRTCIPCSLAGGYISRASRSLSSMSTCDCSLNLQKKIVTKIETKFGQVQHFYILNSLIHMILSIHKRICFEFQCHAGNIRWGYELINDLKSRPRTKVYSCHIL